MIATIIHSSIYGHHGLYISGFTSKHAGCHRSAFMVIDYQPIIESLMVTNQGVQ